MQYSTRIRSNYTRLYSHTFKLYSFILAYIQIIQDSTRIRSNYTRFYSHTFKLYKILFAYVQTIQYSTRIRSNYTFFLAVQLTRDKLTPFIHFSHIASTLELLLARTWAFDESFSLQVHVITTQTLCVSEMSFFVLCNSQGKTSAAMLWP